MAFSRKKVEDRKKWLRAFEPGTFLDHNVSQARAAALGPPRRWRGFCAPQAATNP